MCKSKVDNYIFSHCSIDLNDIGLLNYQDKTTNPEIFKYETGITEEIVVEAISIFLKKYDYTISKGYFQILIENIKHEKILNESLKLWKGSFAEMILTNLFLPNDINNKNNCYIKESFKFDNFLNYFFSDFEVNDNDILFVYPDFFFETIEKYSKTSISKSCIIIMVNVQNIMGPDNYSYFLNHKLNLDKEIIIKGACKFFTALPTLISEKNRETLKLENYFTFKPKNQIKTEYKNSKEVKEKFLVLESRVKTFNFYLELPYSLNNEKLENNEFLIDFKNLSEFIVNNEMLIFLQDLINSVILKTKKYYILKQFFSEKEINEVKQFFKLNSLIKESKNKTKNVCFFVLKGKKNYNLEQLIKQLINNNKSNKQKTYLLDFGEIKEKNFDKIWMAFIDFGTGCYKIL
jgi:hypothetical protein